MYRLGFLIVTILAVVLGLVIGTLNHAPVEIDLLWFRIQWPLGLALIAATAVGVVLGLVLSLLLTVLPLRLKLRQERRGAAAPAKGPTDLTHD